jgi:hypothetical protein
MKNILYTIILSFLFSSHVFSYDTTKFKALIDAYRAGETGIKELKILAERGDVAAQLTLGFVYNRGMDVAQDYQEAVKWYHLAAEQEDEAAQYELGYMYVYGEGVIQDYVLGYMWWNIAASNGYEDAKKYIDFVESMMTPEQLAEAEKLARECIKKNYKDCG